MDTPINKMLVATDGSEAAAKALNYALSLAEKCDAEVQIVSVVPTIDSLIPSSPHALYASLIFDMEKSMETLLSEAFKVAKEKKPNLKVSTRLLRGRPADEIVHVAKEEGFDIIVVGSRGLSGAKELFLGSVSDRVADKAMCPVLIVK
ncbi:universal stress protein [Candidatus Bathyarchaeota archaeon]|nr:universal stress protein [Candidatus Bathyarchaeota archaeon]